MIPLQQELSAALPVNDALLLAHELSQGLLQVQVHIKGAVETTWPTGAHPVLLNSLTATCLHSQATRGGLAANTQAPNVGG